MKILHTSDWHLGQNFMGKSREEEHQAFFLWLLKLIQSEDITLLVVAGDIFDTATPPNYALELYYNFLKELSSIPFLTTIIVAGNHDSVATLKTSQQLLQALNIHVITKGEISENRIIPIYKNSELSGVVCAVPFLRDSVLRHSKSGEGIVAREKFTNHAIKEYYKEIKKEAEDFLKNRGEDQKRIPIIATGHLTTLGARTSDSEREIYIGGTLDIGGNFLGQLFDYVALGHLHINQKVGCEHVRYSGSPISLSFSEAKNIKKVNIATFLSEKDGFDVQTLIIPLYRELRLIKGNLESILTELKGIKSKKIWIEVALSDDDNPFASNQTIRSLASQLNLTLLAVKINRTEKSLQAKEINVISLDELAVSDVFEKRLEMESLQNNDFKEELLSTFKKLLIDVEKQ